MIAGRRVESLGGAHEPGGGPLQRLPHLGRRQPVLTAQAVLEGHDDPLGLPLLDGLHDPTEGSLAPGLRPGDVLLDNGRSKLDALGLCPRGDGPLLLFDGNGLLLRPALAKVGETSGRLGLAGVMGVLLS